jgi:hypothetical protein
MLQVCSTGRILGQKKKKTESTLLVDIKWQNKHTLGQGCRIEGQMAVHLGVLTQNLPNTCN